MRQITPSRLVSRLEDRTCSPPVLLDVREPWEFETCRIDGAVSMPMRSVASRVAELNSDDEIVVICHHGARSYQVALFLEQSGFADVANLQGGVEAWARDVDPAMARY